MDAPLLFRPAHADELGAALRLAGINLFVLADVADEEPAACALVREIGAESFEVCGIAPTAWANGQGISFAHALVREALYESIPSFRRRLLHRQVGETQRGEIGRRGQGQHSVR